MRSRLAMATLGALLLAAPLWGQMRSGGHFGSPVARPGFGGRGFFNGGSGFGHNPRFRFSPGGSPFFFGHRNRFFFSGSFFSSPGYYPGYYPAYGGYSYPVVQTAPPASYYPDQYYENGDLRRDIDVLTGKVDQLREDVNDRWRVILRRVNAFDVAQQTILQARLRK